jgi:hypothetical protein
VSTLELYWRTAIASPFDWAIFALGGTLLALHLLGLYGRFGLRWVFFVQKLDRYRALLLAGTELLPVLGLAGTVWSLMGTFDRFQAVEGRPPDLAGTLRTFAPALSATLSGLLWIMPNLLLNAVLWYYSPVVRPETTGATP